MSTDAPASRRNLLRGLATLRPEPAAAARLLKATTDGSSDLRALADALKADPALAAEALRLANGPSFRRGGGTIELERAVMVLGLTQLHDMAAAMSVLSASANVSRRESDVRGTAALAATLAPLVATAYPDVDNARVRCAALLSEIGALACLMVDPPYASQLDRTWRDQGAREAIELARFGATSWTLGAELLRRNQLPEDIVEAVGSGSDLRERNLPMLTRVTVLCRSLAPLLHGSDFDARELEPWALDAAERADLPDIEPAVLLELCDFAVESFQLRSSVR